MGKWVACLAMAISPWASAALPGAWEEFPTLKNANAWRLYDEFDSDLGNFYTPNWLNSEDPYVYADHYQDWALSFAATDRVANGAFTGNYLVTNVERIYCDVFIDVLEDFSEVDCSIYANGPAGLRWYYSYPYFNADFQSNGWHPVSFYLDDYWYYKVNGETLSFVPTSATLSNIQQISVNFYPKIGHLNPRRAAIDNFILEPKVVARQLTTATPGTNFQISFLKAAGVSYAVEKMTVTPPFAWSVVAGQSAITGSGTHLFTTPRDESKKIFRVKAAAVYTPVVTP